MPASGAGAGRRRPPPRRCAGRGRPVPGDAASSLARAPPGARRARLAAKKSKIFWASAFTDSPRISVGSGRIWWAKTSSGGVAAPVPLVSGEAPRRGRAPGRRLCRRSPVGQQVLKSGLTGAEHRAGETGEPGRVGVAARSGCCGAEPAPSVPGYVVFQPARGGAAKSAVDVEDRAGRKKGSGPRRSHGPPCRHPPGRAPAPDGRHPLFEDQAVVLFLSAPVMSVEMIPGRIS